MVDWSALLTRLKWRMSRRKPLHEVIATYQKEAQLKRVLTWVDLLGLGTGAIIGAGLFVLTGIAARRDAGPSIVLSYFFAGVACVFSGLCYAEFAARIPVAGSAYIYAYCTMGEFVAWLVGWNLILEYVVAVAAVARGWSAYLATLCKGIGFEYPSVLYQIQFNCVTLSDPGQNGSSHPDLSCNSIDLTAFIAVVILTLLTAMGTKTSSVANNIMMVLTFLTIAFIIFGGVAFVEPVNWTDFFPYGFHGTVQGAAVIFFSYVGFDSVSTFAEETANPTRDLPIGVVGSILISSTLYCLVALVITGMVPYYDIDLNAPLASAFAVHGLPWAEIIVSIGAFLALTTSMLTSLMGMPRIFLSMSRDGLFFPVFKFISPRFNTPFWGALITGGVGAILTLTINIELLADLVSIGTLFAFLIVCASVFILRVQSPTKPYRGTVLIVTTIVTLIPPLVALTLDTSVILMVLLWLLPLPSIVLVFREPHYSAPVTFKTPLVPLIPLLGVAANMYLMLNLNYVTWIRFVVWIAIGILVYFCYGIWHSKLETPHINHKDSTDSAQDYAPLNNALNMESEQETGDVYELQATEEIQSEKL